MTDLTKKTIEQALAVFISHQLQTADKLWAQHSINNKELVQAINLSVLRARRALSEVQSIKDTLSDFKGFGEEVTGCRFE